MLITTISIHAPTRGATKFSYLFILCLLFQSTLLQEERQRHRQSITPDRNFNPRSYKRSDCICSAPVQNVYYFNPRSYKRSDDKTLSSKWVDLKFQSTLLQEERPYNFYPFRCYIKISIHAPTRGATAKMHNYPYTYL